MLRTNCPNISHFVFNSENGLNKSIYLTVVPYIFSQPFFSDTVSLPYNVKQIGGLLSILQFDSRQYFKFWDEIVNFLIFCCCFFFFVLCIVHRRETAPFAQKY